MKYLIKKFLKFEPLTFSFLLIIFLTSVKQIVSNDQKYKIVCYFTNWAVKRPGLGSMTPEHVDPCLCTHLIYAFSEMKDNKLDPMEKYDQIDGDKPGFFDRINNLKQKNPKLKTLLAVGGWEMGMGDFTNMVKDEKSMKKFVSTTVDYLKKWNFDGLDLDFEYPGIDWRGSPPEDKVAFTKLCKMLREAFEKDSRETGRERMLLTAAVAGAKNTIDKAYEVDKVSEYLDWWNLMTYDLHGPWDTNAGHHSAINGKDSQDYLYIDFIVKYYESKGAPRNKLMLGLANYGRSDAPAMPYTGFKGESGFLSYYESCLMLSCENWKEFWNEAQLVPYAKGKENYPWAGYDNVKSMKAKAEYIIKQNLAGAMFWTVDLDDFTGKFCCQGFFPLIRTVKSILENEPKFMPPEGICPTCPTKEYKTLKKKTNKRKKRSANEICTEKGEGVWADPTDCTKYYICRSMSTAWAEKKQEVCYTGSYFDQKGGQCKWVGVGNYNCDTILGKETEKETEDKVKENETKSAKQEEENSESSIGGIDSVRNRQKIFYDLANGKQQSDSIIPPNLYTCSAELTVEYETNSDYIKCYACDSDAKSLQKCKGTPNSDLNLIVWCNSKSQKCYSKALYNTTNAKSKNEEIISFSRGCASLSDLESNDQSLSSTKESTVASDKSSKSVNNVKCIQRTNTTKTCYIVCDTHLCNVQTEVKASLANLNGSSLIINSIVLILVLISNLIYSK